MSKFQYSKAGIAGAALAALIMVPLTAIAGPGGTTAISETYDFDGNDVSDILSTNFTNGVIRTVKLENETSTLGSGFPGVVGDFTISGAGKFTDESDGRDSIYLRNTTTGLVKVQKLDTDGNNPNGSGFPFAPPLTFSLGGIADVDGDGVDDAVYVKREAPNAGLVRVWLLNSDLTVKSTSFPTAIPAGFTLIGVGNADGVEGADLIAEKTEAPNVGLIRVFLLSTDGSDVVSVSGSTFPGATITGFATLAVGFFNADDRADLLTIKTEAPNIGLLRVRPFGAGAGTLDPNTFPGGVAAPFEAVAFGNYDGVNQAELMGQNPGNGLVRIWVFNADASAITSTGFPTSLDPAVFQIETTKAVVN